MDLRRLTNTCCPRTGACGGRSARRAWRRSNRHPRGRARTRRRDPLRGRRRARSWALLLTRRRASAPSRSSRTCTSGTQAQQRASSARALADRAVRSSPTAASHAHEGDARLGLICSGRSRAACARGDLTGAKAGIEAVAERAEATPPDVHGDELPNEPVLLADGSGPTGDDSPPRKELTMPTLRIYGPARPAREGRFRGDRRAGDRPR